MARDVNVSVQNNFSKGLVTEATGLSFPENACTDVNNVIFDRSGMVSRRFGIDFESMYSGLAEDMTARVPVTYLWNNAAGNGDISFVVVQMGDELHFYRVQEGALSAQHHATTFNLTAFSPGAISVASLECQFATGNGLLFVTNPRTNSFYVSYNQDTNALTATQITLQIRDFKGDTADALGDDERPTSTLAGLTSAHRYNLKNQGWTTTTLTSWDTARTDMPSNCDVSWYFKSSTDAFDFSTVNDRAVGNSRAPRGHFIYNVYSITRSTNESGATDESIALARVSTCAFFSGRVFYSGLKSPEQNSRIFFSQVVENSTQYGKCFQVNDPTSEQLFDLLPTDGGVIDIPEAGSIIKMMPVLNTLVVFATNGIWAITGSQGLGFRANDYSVNKLSNLRVQSHTSFVDVDGSPFWWTQDGIYTVTIDPQTNALKVTSISKPLIDSFFEDIVNETKLLARGAYDPFHSEVHWLYKSRTSVSFEDKYNLDRILIYSLPLNAFYVWSVDTTQVKMHGVVNVVGAGGVAEEFTVVDGADTVINSADTVIEFISGASATSNQTFTTKYFISYLDGATPRVAFGEHYDESYLDWDSRPETAAVYDSHFVSGYTVRGQGLRKYQSNYVTLLVDSRLNGLFKFQSQWNYSNDPDTGKWSTTQLVNTVNESMYDYKPHRLKVRGNGTACQFRVENHGQSPFNIVGWSVFETGNKWI